MNLLAIIDHNTFGDSFLEIALKTSEKASMIWYRIKNTEACEVVKRCKTLRNLLTKDKLILSERADIASVCSFDGVHLNSACLPAQIVKKIYPSLLVGYSAHSVEDCLMNPCDYFTLSPIFDTPKNYAVTPLGPIKAPAENVYALGGITPDNCKQMEQLGYKGVAGIRLAQGNLDLFKK